MAGPSRRDWALVLAAAAQARESAGGHGIGPAWVVGSAEDALAVLVVTDHEAARHGRRDDSRSPVSLTLRRPVGVPLKLSSVPSCLDVTGPGRPTRWIPDERSLGRVLLGQPDDPVSLAVVRMDAPGSDEDLRRVVEAVTIGAQVVLLGPSHDRRRVASLLSMTGMLPADDQERIWIKSRASAPGNSRAVPADPGEVVTLADHVARMELVDSHRRLAYALARRFRNRGERDADLEQVALLALIRAAKRYDPSHEAGFGSFATASVLGELKRHFRDKAWMMRVPRSLKDRYLAVKTAEEELCHILKASPTVEQIAEHIGVSAEDVIDAMEAGRDFSPMSMDAPVGADGSHLDVASNHDDVELSLSLMDLRQSLEALEPGERMLLNRVFYERQPQRAIALELGVSQMQVSRMVARTIKKLRRSMAPAG